MKKYIFLLPILAMLACSGGKEEKQDPPKEVEEAKVE